MRGGGAPERLKAPVSKTSIAVARFGLVERTKLGLIDFGVVGSTRATRLSVL